MRSSEVRKSMARSISASFSEGTPAGPEGGAAEAVVSKPSQAEAEARKGQAVTYYANVYEEAGRVIYGEWWSSRLTCDYFKSRLPGRRSIYRLVVRMKVKP